MGAGVVQAGAWRRDIETEAVWPGTAPANPGTGHRIPIISESITQDPEMQDRGTLYKQVSEEPGTLAGFRAAGGIVCDVRYGDLDRLYAAALGFENPDTDAAGGSPNQFAVGEERHVYECHPDLRSLVWSSGDRAASTGTAGQEGHWLSTHRKQARGGIYISKGVSDFRLWPAMVNTMELSFGMRNSRVSFGFFGHQLTRGIYNSANWTSYNGLSYNDSPGVSQVLMPQLTAKWGIAGSSVWSDAAMGVSELTINLNNGLDGDSYSSAGGLYILEPWRNGKRSVTGSFTITRYADDAMRLLVEADIQLMFQFNFSGPSLGANNAELSLGFPAVKVDSLSEPVEGAGVIQQRVEFTAHRTNAALGTVWQGSGEPYGGVTLTQLNNGRPSEILIATLNEYDQNVFEND